MLIRAYTLYEWPCMKESLALGLTFEGPLDGQLSLEHVWTPHGALLVCFHVRDEDPLSNALSEMAISKRNLVSNILQFKEF